MGPLLALPAVVTFTFPATFAVAGLTVRWETLLGALGGLAALVLGAAMARRTPLDASLPPDWPVVGPDRDGPNHLPADDLLYLALAALPGAVLGGRLGYLLLHLDYYGDSPSAVLDISRGGLELSMAVVGGVLTAGVAATLLGAPVGRWLHALALPLLLLLGLVKAAMLLGGSGQGLPSDFTLATRYLGPGPWGSLAPEIPSWPSQAMEAVGTLLAGGVAWVMMATGLFSRRNGASFFLAIGLWAVARAVVAATWRDPEVAGPLSAGQLLALAVAAGCAMTVLGYALAEAARLRRPPAPAPDEAEPGTGRPTGSP